jgi:spore maturation protein CgeB
VKNNADTVLEMARQIRKPVIPILANFVEDNLDYERVRIETYAALRKAGFPVYTKIQDAVYAIGSYFEWAEKQPAKKGKKQATLVKKEIDIK